MDEAPNKANGVTVGEPHPHPVGGGGVGGASSWGGGKLRHTRQETMAPRTVDRSAFGPLKGGIDVKDIIEVQAQIRGKEKNSGEPPIHHHHKDEQQRQRETSNVEAAEVPLPTHSVYYCHVS